jgi:RNA polymerase-binding transcription factor DksA
MIYTVAKAIKEDLKQRKRARNMFLAGQITKEEFGMCLAGRAEITGNRLRFFRTSRVDPQQYWTEVRCIDPKKFRVRK